MDFKASMKIDTSDIAEKMSKFTSVLSKHSLTFIFVCSVAYCSYLLYRNIYYPDWSESKKTEYRNSKGSGVVFNEGKFNSVVSREEERKKKYVENVENVPDIFKLK